MNNCLQGIGSLFKNNRTTSSNNTTAKQNRNPWWKSKKSTTQNNNNKNNSSDTLKNTTTSINSSKVNDDHKYKHVSSTINNEEPSISLQLEKNVKESFEEKIEEEYKYQLNIDNRFSWQKGNTSPNKTKKMGKIDIKILSKFKPYKCFYGQKSNSKNIFDELQDNECDINNEGMFIEMDGKNYKLHGLSNNDPSTGLSSTSRVVKILNDDNTPKAIKIMSVLIKNSPIKNADPKHICHKITRELMAGSHINNQLQLNPDSNWKYTIPTEEYFSIKSDKNTLNIGIMMPFVGDGQTLNDVVNPYDEIDKDEKRNRIDIRGMDITEVNRLCRDLGAGLKQLHSARVLHRDIKLENIVENQGHFKIIDFGSVFVNENHKLNLNTVFSDVILSNEYQQGECCGSDPFMSPEMAMKYDIKNDFGSYIENELGNYVNKASKVISEKSDIFSTAVTAATARTGEYLIGALYNNTSWANMHPSLALFHFLNTLVEDEFLNKSIKYKGIRKLDIVLANCMITNSEKRPDLDTINESFAKQNITSPLDNDSYEQIKPIVNQMSSCQTIIRFRRKIKNQTIKDYNSIQNKINTKDKNIILNKCEEMMKQAQKKFDERENKLHELIIDEHKKILRDEHENILNEN
ncbi:MAG: protein kinase [bacterium]|nr:protein kinase [bacterium]